MTRDEAKQSSGPPNRDGQCTAKTCRPYQADHLLQAESSKLHCRDPASINSHAVCITSCATLGRIAQHWSTTGIAHNHSSGALIASLPLSAVVFLGLSIRYLSPPLITFCLREPSRTSTMSSSLHFKTKLRVQLFKMLSREFIPGHVEYNLAKYLAAEAAFSPFLDGCSVETTS